MVWPETARVSASRRVSALWDGLCCECSSARLTVASIVNYLTVGVRLCQPFKRLAEPFLVLHMQLSQLEKVCQEKSARGRQIVGSEIACASANEDLQHNFR